MHETAHETTTGRLFARGIEQITDLYIDPIPAQKLVIVGAKNLSKLDNRLAASVGTDIRDRDQLTTATISKVRGSTMMISSLTTK